MHKWEDETRTEQQAAREIWETVTQRHWETRVSREKERCRDCRSFIQSRKQQSYRQRDRQGRRGRRGEGEAKREGSCSADRSQQYRSIYRLVMVLTVSVCVCVCVCVCVWAWVCVYVLHWNSSHSYTDTHTHTQHTHTHTCTHALLHSKHTFVWLSLHPLSRKQRIATLQFVVDGLQ